MSIGHIVNNSKYMKAITVTLMSSMILLSGLATAAQDVHSKKDIVDVAVANGNFNTLAAALKAAGLVGVLKGEGPFTVFAPTDEAFAKLPEGTVESLLKPENIEQLKAVLTYHVVSGKVMAADVVKLSTATTVNGADVKISVVDKAVKLNDASTVVLTDVNASNGVIHVIDSVILPPSS
ncbi:MAG: putative surface protein with fasciclin (FAS1) repeats [Gammaproteobacteria bacterium]|jgi:uncharacterized surface protein with fasciclin (FAS1) repeats